MVEVECHTCGETTHKQPNEIEGKERLFCSLECYHNAGRETLTCEQCGDEFTVRKNRAEGRRFCDSDCRDEHLRNQTGEDHPMWNGGMVEVECHTCGESVEKKPAQLDKSDRHFCSRGCYHEAGRPDMRGENNPANPSTEKVPLDCEQCGDEFKVYPYRADSSRFCSRECVAEHHRGLTGEDSPRWEGAKETYECQNCGGDFEEYPYQNDGKYCSESCYREAAKELFAGDNNPVWRGGCVDNYGPNWEDQREAALERDGYTCQHCGTHADEMDRSPHVHHKKRLGWFKEEYDAPEWWEKGNRLDNLVTLCPACHMKEEWENGGLN